MNGFIKFMHRAARPVWVGLNVLIAGITLLSAFGGDIDPNTLPFAGIATMTFPVWYLLTAVCLVADLVVNRWLAIVPALALLIAIETFLDFCPLNFGRHEVPPDAVGREFKILSYNTLSFRDESVRPIDPRCNRTMHAVLASGADAVVLIEYENQGPLAKFVPQAQIDSLHAIYPYFSRGKRGTVLYSKTPIARLTPPPGADLRGYFEGFRTFLSKERKPVNIFAVHLESIGLSDNDKELYREITDKAPERVNVGKVRNQLVEKLYAAFIKRAEQARELRDYVEAEGGNAIVCGDFNDVPSCYTIKTLEKIGLQDAYAKVGFGPTITFNAPHFFFRIDHVLWRGDFKAVKIQRGNVPSSDHYPLLTTFVFDD